MRFVTCHLHIIHKQFLWIYKKDLIKMILALEPQRVLVRALKMYEDKSENNFPLSTVERNVYEKQNI